MRLTDDQAMLLLAISDCEQRVQLYRDFETFDFLRGLRVGDVVFVENFKTFHSNVRFRLAADSAPTNSLRCDKTAETAGRVSIGMPTFVLLIIDDHKTAFNFAIHAHTAFLLVKVYENFRHETVVL
ncbi:unnamed protein product [Nippostrongylus brasiliensis]|uniref:Uncharacterized protein n=1 Tax=Nippostrongylus brasiliensis TaxID=27835 RepID=A0A158R3I0_NIPBR|nr:unnamed protein product [Nippostrongylus brasiliensis]